MFSQRPISRPYCTVINDLRRFDFTYDIDYGPLPTSRVYETGAGTGFEAGVLNIGFNDGIELAQAEEIIRSYNSYIIPESALGFKTRLSLSIQIPFDKTTSEMITEFNNNPDVRYAERNSIASVGLPISL